jgi:hypothetical protein
VPVVTELPASDPTPDTQLVKSEPVPFQVRGTIHGAAADLAISVVFLGPDNLLREAARVRAGPDGRWSISGLSAGRYRVQLDAGGARAVITDPPFRTLVIDQTPGPSLTADFRVSGAF